MVYRQKIKCTKYQLKEEIRKAWPNINKIWLKLVNQDRLSPTQMKLWKKCLYHYAVLNTLIAQFIPMLVISPKTSVVERGYSELSKHGYFIPISALH